MTLARFRQATLSLRILDQVMDQPEDRPSTVGFVNREIKQGGFSSRMSRSIIQVPITRSSANSI